MTYAEYRKQQGSEHLKLEVKPITKQSEMTKDELEFTFLWHLNKLIAIKHDDMIFDRKLYWSEKSKRFYVEYNKERYEIARDYTELGTVFILIDKIIE